jgi:chemotaxis protein CheC
MSQGLTNTISAEELDILQEIMNIAFGKATADLAEIIDIFVNLSVPMVKIIKTNDLPSYVRIEIQGLEDISTVQQKFWGGLRGSALLVFPAGIGKDLIGLLSGESSESFASDPLDELEKGTLMEIGNILIGACVGKMTELLHDGITYSPPIVHTGQVSKTLLPQSVIDSFDTTIALRTSFSFEKRNIVGFLFIITSEESFAWLRKALNNFLEEYT